MGAIRSQPFELDGVLMQMRAKVGIARIPVGTGDPRSPLRYAQSVALRGPVAQQQLSVPVAQLHDGQLAYCLFKTIETSGIEPTAIELELTETGFAEDLDRPFQLLSAVRPFVGRVAIGAALAVARTLKIEVIVETAMALERVRAPGATNVQDFYFANRGGAP